MLHVRNLTIRHGTTVLVRDLSFSLEKGQTLGLVGESGSGKTLTALALMGLLPAGMAATGEIAVGESVVLAAALQMPTRQRLPVRLAMIFQDAASALNPTMRCGVQIAEALGTLEKSARRARVLELLREVQLPDSERIYRAYPHELSGGQQQRIVLAMALATDPDVLIADEPTTALDKPLQAQLLATLQQLQQARGLAMLFVSHDFAVIGQMAHRVLVLRQGEMVETADTATLLQSPTDAYTKALLACQPTTSVRYERLPTLADFAQNPHFTPTISTNSSRKVAGNLLLRMAHDGKRYRKQTPFWQPSEWTTALHPATLDIFTGEALGIVGPSGSGKTTLGRLLEKWPLASTHGRAPAIVRIAQNPYATLQPRLPIGEAVAEPLRVHRLCKTAAEARQRATALLEAVGLPSDMYHRLPQALSGGQRQRVSIARALAVQPRLLICDEITSALDVSVQAAVVNLLLDLRERLGLTYVFISHDEALVYQCCDRVLRLAEGRFV